MIKNIIFLCILIITYENISLALTWNEALNRAALKSNDIKSAQKQTEASKWEYYRAYSPFLPQLSANLSSGQSTSNSTLTKSNSFGLGVSQSLFKGLSNYYSFQTAYKNYEYDAANLKKVESDFYYNLRLSYIDLFIAQEKISIANEILKKRSDNARMIKLLYDSGKEDKGNSLRTKAQEEEARYNLSAAKREFELSKYKIEQILENSVDKADNPREIGAGPFQNIDALAKSSPLYALSKYQLEIAEISKNSSISEFLPNISLNGSYQKTGSDWPPQSANKSFSINFSYSLFPGGSNIANYTINAIRLDKAREDFEKAKKDIYYSIKQAYKNLTDAKAAFDLQKIFLNASNERAKIAHAKYLNGLILYDEWDRLQSEFIANKNNLISSHRSALYAEAAWHKSYGGWIK